MRGRRWILGAVGAVVVLGVLALVLVLVTRGADGVVGTLREDDAGAVVEMSVGEHVVVKLEGNPTTGFTWEVAQVDRAVLVPSGEPDYESDSDAEGSGGTYTFRFAAVGRGEAEVVMVYRRTWEGEEPADTFTFRVLVG
jgi:inhibitor of cysteine peptidase